MADPVDLLYDAGGLPGANAPVVLLHGFPLSRALWTPTLTALASERRVIAPDLRGHGASPAPDVKTTMDDHARDVLRLADAVGARRVHLVAHSMGGYVAFSISRQAPERIASLALVATRATPDSPEAKAGRRKQADMVQMDGVRALADLLVPKLVAPRASSLVREEARRMIEGTPVTGIVRNLEAMAERPDSTPILREIKTPTLVVAGADDTVMPPQETDRLAREIPHARKEAIPGTGHLPMMEDPVTFHAVLRAFLREFD